jgi:hypothetical protein
MYYSKINSCALPCLPNTYTTYTLVNKPVVVSHILHKVTSKQTLSKYSAPPNIYNKVGWMGHAAMHALLVE